MQRSRKRLSIAVGVATIAALALTGCGASATTAPTSSPTSIAGAKLTLWIPNSTTSAAIQSYAENWAKKNKVTVDVTVQPSAQSLQTLSLALHAGTGPDVWNGQNPTIIQYAHDLKGLLDQDTLDAYKQFTTAPSSYVLNGKLVGIPTTLNTFRLVYNKDVLKSAGLDAAKPPTTLNGILKDCKAIAAKTQAYCVGVPAGWAPFSNYEVDPLIESGNAKLTPNGLFNVTTGKYQSDLYAPAVEYYRELVSKGWAYPGASSLDYNTMQAAFADGKIAMYIGAATDITQLNDTLATKIDWAAAPVPVPDGQRAVRGIAALQAPYMINQATKYPEAAAQLLEALTSADLMKKLAATGTTFPARLDAKAKDTSGFDPQYKDFAATSTDSPILPSPTTVLPIQGQTVYQAIAALVLGTGDIDSTLKQYASSYQQLYQSALDTGTIADKKQYQK